MSVPRFLGRGPTDGPRIRRAGNGNRQHLYAAGPDGSLQEPFLNRRSDDGRRMVLQQSRW